MNMRSILEKRKKISTTLATIKGKIITLYLKDRHTLNGPEIPTALTTNQGKNNHREDLESTENANISGTQRKWSNYVNSEAHDTPLTSFLFIFYFYKMPLMLVQPHW